MPSPPIQETAEKPRASCCGCLFTTSIGGVAFAVGAFLAGGLLSPPLIGDYVVDRLETSANAHFSGSLRIGSAHMSWDGEQRLNDVVVFAPTGEEILTASVGFPSLFELLELGLAPFTLRVDVARADIVVGADGRSNLERALAPRSGTPAVVHEEPPAWERALRRYAQDPWGLPFRLDVSGGRWVVAGPGSEGVLETIATIEDVAVTLESDRTGSPRVRFHGEAQVQGVERGELRWQLDAARARPRSLADVRGELTAHNVSAHLVDVLLGSSSTLADVCGETLTVSAAIGAGEQDPAVTALKAELRSPRSHSTFSARLTDGRLVPAGDAPFEAELAVPESLFEAPFAAFLDEWGAGLAACRLAREPLEATWSIHASDFDLPDALAAASLDDWIADAHVDVVLAGGGALALSAPDGVEVARLREPSLRVVLAEAGSRTTELTAVVARDAAEDPGALRVTVDHPGRDAEPEDGDSVYTLDLHAEHVPTRLVDRWLELEPILTETLGPECSLDLGPATIGGDAFDGRLYSPEGEVRWSGGLSRDMLFSKAEGGIDARVALSDALHERLLRRLVPWLVDVEKPDGADPVHVRVGFFELPLDRDLAQLDAHVVIDFGELHYRFFPGIEELVGGESGALRTGRIEPIELSIGRGEVHYERLPLSLGGVDCSLEGSLDLSDGTIDLQAEVPLRLMSRRQGLDPELVDAVVDPAAMMPVRLLGTWDEPSLSVEIHTLMRLFNESLGTEVWESLKGAWSRAARRLIERD